MRRQRDIVTLSGLRRSGVTLALGGGAARGLAHIGVLKALAEEGIAVHAVAGTSAGSVVGAALAAGRDWHWILQRARLMRWSDLAQIVVPRRGLMSLQRLEAYVGRELGASRFDQLALPLAVVATDLATGEAVVFTSGPLGPAVRASCSVPGVFEPAIVDGRTMVDGGLVDEVPVRAARSLGGKVVVAVNLTGPGGPRPAPRSIVDVLLASFEILAFGRSRHALAEADLVVAPDLEQFGYRDLRRLEELVDAGERATREALARFPP